MASWEDILIQSRKPLVSSVNPGINSGVDKRDKQLQKIKQQQEELIWWADSDAEAAYIRKNPGERDKYDIAFWTLNPDSVAKAKKYHNLEQKRIEIENEKINLEWARDFMNQVYAQQKQDVNNRYNRLNSAYAIWNRIALGTALAGAWAAGANGVQKWALSAQANNSLVAQILQNEAQRSSDLATAAQNEAALPWQLSSIWANNASIDATRENLELQRQQLANQARSSWSSWYSSSSSKKTDKSWRWKDEDWVWHYKEYEWDFSLDQATELSQLSQAELESRLVNNNKKQDFDAWKREAINKWKADWSPTQDKAVRLLNRVLPKTTAWKVTSLVSPQRYAVAKWLFPSF